MPRKKLKIGDWDKRMVPQWCHRGMLAAWGLRTTMDDLHLDAQRDAMEEAFHAMGEIERIVRRGYL